VQALRRIEVLLQRSLRGKVASNHDMWNLLKQAHRVHSGLHVFCQTLQTYIMFDVIESGWDTFSTSIHQVRCCPPLQVATVLCVTVLCMSYCKLAESSVPR
jgi:hypothetical protein